MFHFRRLAVAGRNVTNVRNCLSPCGAKYASASSHIQCGKKCSRHLSYCSSRPALQTGLPRTISNSPWSLMHRRHYSDLPSHQTLLLPALSPTMETGSLVSWEKKVGDEISEGDLLCEIETDKATMGFEAGEAGYLAKILVEQGTKDLPLGTALCVVVEDKGDIDAFADVTADQLGVSGAEEQQQEKQSSSSSTSSSASSGSGGGGGGGKASDLPDHQAVPLPALSPTMEMGTIVSWEKKEGDFVKEGDLLAEIETDKATMGFEASDEGYLAKIFVPAGEKNVPLGTLLCVMVDSQDSVAKFASVSAADLGDGSAASAAAGASTSAASGQQQQPQQQQPQQQQQQQQQQQTSAPSRGDGDRVKASPYARRLAKEKGVSLSSIGTASGADGRIVSADVENAPRAASKPAASASASPSSSPSPPAPSASYTDRPLSSMRSTIAKRLTASKQSIPHYYLNVQIRMDRVLQLRSEANKRLAARGSKLSVNDFVIKAAAVALGRVPECNSSWQDTFIRQHNHADICVAVATDNGLITPIVFNADAKGLLSINSDVVSLAEKARANKLKPQEFQGGTFTISNLGMFGIQSFSAIINPPQACILAVGGAQKILVPSTDAPEGFTSSTVMHCTLCCDHRVVDGAIGARWLTEFKECLEDPYNMLL